MMVHSSSEFRTWELHCGSWFPDRRSLRRELWSEGGILYLLPAPEQRRSSYLTLTETSRVNPTRIASLTVTVTIPWASLRVAYLRGVLLYGGLRTELYIRGKGAIRSGIPSASDKKSVFAQILRRERLQKPFYLNVGSSHRSLGFFSRPNICTWADTSQLSGATPLR
ncbi:uncharacterized protein B0T15DRAFT_201488 [Chaetomium strumarium]|uniref:Uncharacterized protein n=1 Tax=Chaetomium strumarium TaxID=1170767 RepID=A0AAJ0M1L9_9PEZI|nr:hypothetical protein B0T15DRAFT_201488 [Chaetomium strumarium]